MIYKIKKIISFSILISFISIFSSIVIISKVLAEDNTTRDYQDGPSFESSHDIDTDTQLWNYAVMAHAWYWYNQKSSLPVQVYYIVYPHLEGGENVTMNCHIESNIKYRIIFVFNKNVYTDITYNDFINNTNCTGYLNGPNFNAIEIETIYTFNDAVYGACTWTINGD